MDIQTAIDQVAGKLNLNPLLISAIIEVESGGVAWRTRFEDHFKYVSKFHEHASRLGITFMTEYVHQKTSWGLMQVMGGTARDCGFRDHLPKLCLPEEGIYWGSLYLKKMFNRYKASETQEKDAIAAYNAGVARADASGNYRNQGYVSKVLDAKKKAANPYCLTRAYRDID